MDQSFIPNKPYRRVANRALRARILATLKVLGQLTGPEAAIVGYGGPPAVRRRRLIRVTNPTGPQLSATRRALARMKADNVVVVLGRHGRRKIYRLRRDAEALEAITLGAF